jgi:hypothetical protein
MVTIATWVVETICELVADIVDLVVAVVVGLYDILAGLFTGNWARMWDGLVEIAGGIGQLIGLVIRTVTLGGLVGAFIDGANRWALRDYVRGLVGTRYSGTPETRDAVLDALGVTGSKFGLNLNGTAQRSFIRSDFVSPGGTTPDLAAWIQNAAFGINLQQLAGFDYTSFWRRGRPELIGDSGDISSDDLNTWVAQNGVGSDVKQFTLFCMKMGVFQDRLDVAKRKGEDLAIFFNWTFSDIQLISGDQVVVDDRNFLAFLTAPPFNRHSTSDMVAATNELCSPAVIGVFRYRDDSLNGLSAHLVASTCVSGARFPSDGATAATFKDRLPDFVWQWVPIHELGHTFGLCHVDGLDHIMYTAAAAENKSWWDWSVLFNYLLVSGEPGFTLDEQKKVWDYIIANFSTDCLLANKSRR